MVTVKLYGTFRLDSRLQKLELNVKSVKEIYPYIISEVKKHDPNTALTEKDLKGGIIAINGKQSRPNAKLCDGDEVCIMPAIAGG